MMAYRRWRKISPTVPALRKEAGERLGDALKAVAEQAGSDQRKGRPRTAPKSPVPIWTGVSGGNTTYVS